jgi:hypothetical protein
VSENSVGKMAFSGVARPQDAKTGLSRRRGKRLALKTGLEFSFCRSPGVGASPNHDSKWKFRFHCHHAQNDLARRPGPYKEIPEKYGSSVEAGGADQVVS